MLFRSRRLNAQMVQNGGHFCIGSRHNLDPFAKGKPSAFIFFMLLAIFWSLMGYWPMLIINLIAGIVAEIIIGSYEDDKRVAAAVATGMFIISMHAMTFVKILGPEKLVEVFTVFSPEQAQYMYTFFTPKAMLISIAINIVLVIASCTVKREH